MPKKHRQAYLNTKPNYVHSLSGGKRGAATEDTQPSPATVNERLSQLRIAQASPSSADQKQALADLSNQRSLPPSLGQGIFGLPPTAAPAPRQGLRSRIRLRTPGPAPPPSWSRRSTPLRQIDEARYRRSSLVVRRFGRKSVVDRSRPDELARFLNLIGENHVRHGTLLHQALRSAAENWEAIVEDVVDDLDYLPLHLRTVLLSFLSTYGPPDGIDIKGVRALFSSISDAACLDLSGHIGWSLSLKELRKWLTTPVISSTDFDAGAKPQVEDEIADSWEESTGEVYMPLAPALKTRIPFLTKLSLGYPPSSVSWSDLLSLSKDLGTLTHLSLAYWPIPTRTPNMKTASYISQTGSEHAASATSLYSASDRDFQESTIILRQLSEHTYCLRWLDLLGCSLWLPALTAGGTATIRTTTTDPQSGWSHNHSRPQGPDWSGSWRNISYLNTSQDWTPTNRRFMNSAAFKGRIVAKYYHLTQTHLQIIQDLQSAPSLGSAPDQDTTTPTPPLHCHICGSRRDSGAGDANCTVCTAYYDQETARLARWLEREADAWVVGRSINMARARAGGGARCVFDHGWQKRETYPTTTRV